MRWIVPSGKMLSSSPSANMHFIVPSGNLKPWLRRVLHDLLGAVGEVLLYLVVSELEDLEPVWEGSLRGLGFGEVVDDALVGVGLFDVAVVKVDNGVAVGEDLALNTVVEDHLLLPVLIDALDLAIVTDDLLHHFHVGCALVVVVKRELHVEVLLFLIGFLS